MQLLAKTMLGLEQVLAQELQELGATNILPLQRAVQFEGDQKLLYRANLELRTALRILKPFHSFKTKHENHLYKKLREIDWETYLGVDDTLAIDAVTTSKYLTHSKYLSLKTKDAIVDQFREKYERRPSIDLKRPTVRLNIHINSDNVCTLSLDSSGESLHKRGYRVDAVEAPINEVLAAGMILLSGWQKDCIFLDPMCGSGTIPIEAAYYAYNIPPQLYRDYFGFKKWKDFDADLWETVLREAKERIQNFTFPIFGFDSDFQALKISSQNVLAAHLEGKVEIDLQKFEKLEPPAEKGFMIMNPPYDERLPVSDTEAFYKKIGDTLKQNFAGYTAWIISSNLDALKNIGLRPSRKMTLFNGPLECKFQKYDLYKGSKKG